MTDLFPAVVADAPAIDHLLDRCFGPARRNRTAYRLRDGVTASESLSFVAREGQTLVGSIQLWPLELRDPAGRARSMILLGPLAVAREHRCAGIGSRLLAAALERVDAEGGVPVVLIGDEPYYGRFGFTAAPTAAWVVPGPVDRTRLLVRGGEGLPATASLGPARERVSIAA